MHYMYVCSSAFAIATAQDQHLGPLKATAGVSWSNTNMYQMYVYERTIGTCKHHYEAKYMYLTTELRHRTYSATGQSVCAACRHRPRQRQRQRRRSTSPPPVAPPSRRRALCTRPPPARRRRGCRLRAVAATRRQARRLSITSCWRRHAPVS